MDYTRFCFWFDEYKKICTKIMSVWCTHPISREVERIFSVENGKKKIIPWKIHNNETDSNSTKRRVEFKLNLNFNQWFLALEENEDFWMYCYYYEMEMKNENKNKFCW